MAGTNFWKSLPGLITAVGTLISAVAAVIVALATIGFFDSEEGDQQGSQAREPYSEPLIRHTGLEPQVQNTETLDEECTILNRQCNEGSGDEAQQACADFEVFCNDG